MGHLCMAATFPTDDLESAYVVETVPRSCTLPLLSVPDPLSKFTVAWFMGLHGIRDQSEFISTVGGVVFRGGVLIFGL